MESGHPRGVRGTVRGFYNLVYRAECRTVVENFEVACRQECRAPPVNELCYLLRRQPAESVLRPVRVQDLHRNLARGGLEDRNVLLAERGVRGLARETGGGVPSSGSALVDTSGGGLCLVGRVGTGVVVGKAVVGGLGVKRGSGGKKLGDIRGYFRVSKCVRLGVKAVHGYVSRFRFLVVGNCVFLGGGDVDG